MKFITPLFVLAALSVAAVRAQSPAPATLEDRLARLERQLARIEARLGDYVSSAELAPALKEFSELNRQLGHDGKTPLTVVKAGGKEQKLSIGGYVQAHGEFGGVTDSRYVGINNRVLLRRARVTVRGSFQEAFEFVLQPDFGNNSISGITGYRGGFADAYVAWNKYEAATLQLGQYKTHFGYDQLTPDTKLMAVERSLPNDLLTVSRQIGFSLLGSAWAKRLTYSIGAFNGNGVNNGNNDNDQFMYAGRVAAVVWAEGAAKLTVAVNGYAARETGTFIGHRTGRGVDAQFTWGGLELQGEYLNVLQNRLTGADTTADGWYATVGYFVVPKTWQAVVRYESYDANVRASGLLTKVWVFGANYLIKGDDLKLSFNYSVGDPAGPLPREGRVMGRMQVIF
jgi:phosphate-selective porin